MSFTSLLKRSSRVYLYLFFTLIILSAGCSGIHIIPMQQGESIELQFDGPVTLSYVLADGNEQVVTVEDELELVLANQYDDGDPGNVSGAERFLSYFRLNAEGGAIHLGPDPELRKISDGELEFPDPAVIADYLATAQFEFTNQPGGLLKNSEAIQMMGNFVGAKAYRYEYSCVDPLGNTVFIYDVHVPKLCNTTNHIEISEELHSYSYTRAEIVARTAGNLRSMLNTRFDEDLGGSHSLVLKIVNINPAPNDPNNDDNPGSDDNGAGESGGDGISGDSDPSTLGSAGGCSIHPKLAVYANVGGWQILLAALLLLLILRLKAVGLERK